MRCCAIGRGPRPLRRACGPAPGERWHPEEILLLPDGSDGRMRRLRYTGPGAVLVTIAHERVERVIERAAAGGPRRGPDAAPRIARREGAPLGAVR